MKRIIPARAILCAQTFVGIGMSLWAEDERVYALRIVGGKTAAFVVLLMFALTCIAAVDIVMSETSSRLWSAIRRKRWAVWAGMSAGHTIQMCVAIGYGFTPWVALQYGVIVAGCLWVACLDLHYRECDAVQRRAATAAGTFDDTPMERKWRA